MLPEQLRILEDLKGPFANFMFTKIVLSWSTVLYSKDLPIKTEAVDRPVFSSLY